MVLYLKAKINITKIISHDEAECELENVGVFTSILV
jgi:hypothetical protein